MINKALFTKRGGRPDLACETQTADTWYTLLCCTEYTRKYYFEKKKSQSWETNTPIQNEVF